MKLLHTIQYYINWLLDHNSNIFTIKPIIKRENKLVIKTYKAPSSPYDIYTFNKCTVEFLNNTSFNFVVVDQVLIVWL